jgi:hypothetical protein
VSLLCIASAGPVRALDLSVQRIVVTQALESEALPLIAGRVTFVRVVVGVKDARSSVSGVDGLLHILVDGSEAPGSPVFSINGPIVARTKVDESNLDHTLNFWWIAPEAPPGRSAAPRVDLRVELNPPGPARLAESDYRNNSASQRDLTFSVRRGLQIAYVPIDYRPGAAEGQEPRLPLAAAIEPAIGDAFARCVFPTGELDYHQAPMPPLVWTEDIDVSNTLLLNTLADIRACMTQRCVASPLVGGAGGAAPGTRPDATVSPAVDFVYGWLPGNPFDSNGQAIPSGGAAFGNTELRRHQRTFAHEIGHLFGLSHNRMTTDVVGLDVEATGRRPMNLPQVKPPTLRDIMVAGQVSEAAWVNPRTYEYIFQHPTAREGFAREATRLPGFSLPPQASVLRIAGVFYPDENRLALSPTMQFPQGSVSPSATDGRLRVTGWGRSETSPSRRTKLYEITIDGPLQADCGDASEEKLEQDPEAFWAEVPASGPDGRMPVDQLVITDMASGAELISVQRSRHAPVAEFRGLADGTVLRGAVQVEWDGSDADGPDPGLASPHVRDGVRRPGHAGARVPDDAPGLVYTVQYSPDAGQSWAPLAVNLTRTTLEFDTHDVAASRPGEGRLRLIVTDGFNTTVVDSPALDVGSDQPPELFIISPHAHDTYHQAAPVILHAYAWDREDGLIPAGQIEWRSDQDGTLGTGKLWITDSLSLGAHELTVTARDHAGHSSSRQIKIKVVPRPLPRRVGVAGRDPGRASPHAGARVPDTNSADQ